jgi:hypothetical protein
MFVSSFERVMGLMKKRERDELAVPHSRQLIK